MTRSEELYKTACTLIPGGVNSPVRAFKAVGGKPIFIKRGAGSKIYDVDDKEYIDYVGSWGPLILGHAHPDIIRYIKAVIDNGTSFGAPTELEIELAKLIIKYVPSIEMVRMVNSGTEATMSAIRLARGFTRRNIIIKFEGCYHGHADGLLVKAGSGATTLGIPDSLGVPEDYAKNTITLPFNNLSAVSEVFSKIGESIAGIIIEPVVGNIGVVIPNDGFLEGLRHITERYGALLIFDEVMTGFRVSRGGAQELYKIKPDITSLGKIIGGGLPVGAYGGKRSIMEHIAPCGGVYQAGTLSGNPVAMAGGIKMLQLLSDYAVYKDLNKKTDYLCNGLKEILLQKGIPHKINLVGSMFSVFFTDKEVIDYNSAKTSNTECYGRYFTAMLRHGIYLAPSQFEAAFVSSAHTPADLDKTIEAAKAAIKGL